MSKSLPPSPEPLTLAQERLRALWEEHVKHEFATHNTEDTLQTMVEDAYVNHIPVMTGGVGRASSRSVSCPFAGQGADRGMVLPQ